MPKRTGERFLFKVFSIFTSLSFLFPALTWAFNASSYIDPAKQIIFAGQSVDIPKECGDVTSACQGADKLVIFVQDLHCNYEVQKNIARLINFIKRRCGLNLVAVEGASRPVNVSELADFSLPKVRQDAADYLLRQGKITGPEFYAVNHPRAVSLEGVEDGNLYASNRASALKLLNTESQGLLLDLREALQAARRQVDNPALQALNQRQEAYRAHKISCLQYCRQLLSEAQQQGLEPRNWSTIQSYLGQNTEALSRLSLEPLMQEISGIEQAVRQCLYTTPQQAELDLWEHRLDIMEKLLGISVTAEELAEFRSRPDNFRVQGLAAFLSQAAPGSCPEDAVDPDTLGSYLQEALTFYRVADARSRAFANNIFECMQTRGAAVAVLVGGGYHADDVLAELKAKGVSTLCVKPRLTRPDAANPYYAVLQGKRTPLEKLWAQDQKIFAPATAFAEGDGQAWNDPVLQRATRQLLGLGTLWSAWKTERLQDADAIRAYYSRHMQVLLDLEPGLVLNRLTLAGDHLVAGFQRQIAAVLHAADTPLRLENMRPAEISLGEAGVLLARADVEEVGAQLTAGERAPGRLRGIKTFALQVWTNLSRMAAGPVAVGESSMKGYYRAARFARWMIPGMLVFDVNVVLSIHFLAGSWLDPYVVPIYVLLAMLGAVGTMVFAINAVYYQKKFQTLFREVNRPTGPKGLIPLLRNYREFTPPKGRHGLLDRVEKLAVAEAAERGMDIAQVPKHAQSVAAVEIADTVQRLPEFWQYTVAAHVLLHRQVLAGPRLFHGLAEVWATFWEPYVGTALWMRNAKQSRIQAQELALLLGELEGEFSKSLIEYSEIEDLVRQIESLEEQLGYKDRKKYFIVEDPLSGILLEIHPYARYLEGVRTLNIEDGLAALEREINRELEQAPMVIVRLIGQPASGKTRLADRIRRQGLGAFQAEDMVVISTDDFLPEYRRDAMQSLNALLARKKPKVLILDEGACPLTFLIDDGLQVDGVPQICGFKSVDERLRWARLTRNDSLNFRLAQLLVQSICDHIIYWHRVLPAAKHAQVVIHEPWNPDEDSPWVYPIQEKEPGDPKVLLQRLERQAADLERMNISHRAKDLRNRIEEIKAAQSPQAQTGEQGEDRPGSKWRRRTYVSLLLLGAFQTLIHLGQSQTWGTAANAPAGSILTACLPAGLWLPVVAMLALTTGGIALYRHPQSLGKLTNRLTRVLAANPAIRAIFLLTVMNTTAAPGPADNLEKGILKLIQPQQETALRLALRILDQNRADLTLDDLRTRLQGTNADIKFLESIGMLQKVMDTAKGRAVSGLRRVNREFWPWRKFLAVPPDLRADVLNQKIEYFSGRMEHYPPEILGLMDLQVQFQMPLEQIRHMPDEQAMMMAAKVYHQALASHPDLVREMQDIFPYVLVGMARRTAAMLSGAEQPEGLDIPEVKVIDGKAESQTGNIPAEMQIISTDQVPAGSTPEERLQELSRRALMYETMQKLHEELRPQEWRAFLADCLVILDAPAVADETKIAGITALAEKGGMLHAALVRLQLTSAPQWPLALVKAYRNELPGRLPRQDLKFSRANRSPIFEALKACRESEPNRTLAFQAQRLGLGGDKYFVNLIIQHQDDIDTMLADAWMQKIIAEHNGFRHTRSGEQVARGYLAAVLRILAESAARPARERSALKLPDPLPDAVEERLAKEDRYDLVKAMLARQEDLRDRKGPAVLKRFGGFITLDELAEGLIEHQDDFAAWVKTYADVFNAAGYSPETEFGKAMQWLFQAAVIDVKNQKAQARAEAAAEQQATETGAGNSEESGLVHIPEMDHAPSKVKIEIAAGAGEIALDAEELLAYRALVRAFMQAVVQMLAVINHLHAGLQAAETSSRNQEATADTRPAAATVDQVRAAEDQVQHLLDQIPHFYREGAAVILRLLAAAARAQTLRHWLENYAQDLNLLDAVLEAQGMPEYAAAASRGTITINDIRTMLGRRPQWAARVERERRRTAAVRRSLIKHHGYPVLVAAELPAVPLLLARCETIMAWDPAANGIRDSGRAAQAQYQAVANAMHKHRYVISQAASDLDIAGGLGAEEFRRKVQEWRLIDPKFNRAMGLTLALDRQLMQWSEACCYQDRLIRGHLPGDIISRHRLLYRVQGSAEPAADQAQIELLQILQIDIPANYPEFREESRRESSRYREVQAAVEKHHGDFAAAAPELKGIPDAEAYHQRLLRADPDYKKQVGELRGAEDQALAAARAVEAELKGHKDVYQMLLGTVIGQPGMDFDAVCVLAAGYSPEQMKNLPIPAEVLDATAKAMEPVSWEAFRGLVTRVRAHRPAEGEWPLAEILNRLTEPQRQLFSLILYAGLVPAADAAVAKKRLGLDDKTFSYMQRHGSANLLLTQDARKVELTGEAKMLVQVMLEHNPTAGQEAVETLLNWKATQKKLEGTKEIILGITGLLPHMSREAVEKTVFKTRLEMAQAVHEESLDGRERLTLPERVIWEMLNGSMVEKSAARSKAFDMVRYLISRTSTYESLGPIRYGDVDFEAVRAEIAKKSGPGRILRRYGLENYRKIEQYSDADIYQAIQKAWQDPKLYLYLSVSDEVSGPVADLRKAARSSKILDADEAGLLNNGLLVHAFPKGLAKHRLGLPPSIINDMTCHLAVPSLQRIAGLKKASGAAQEPSLQAIQDVACYFFQQNTKLLAQNYPEKELRILQRALTAYTADELIAEMSGTPDRQAALLKIEQQTYAPYAPGNLSPDTQLLLDSVREWLTQPRNIKTAALAFQDVDARAGQKHFVDMGFDAQSAKMLLIATAQCEAFASLDHLPEVEHDRIVTEIRHCLKWISLQAKARYPGKKMGIAEFLEFYPGGVQPRGASIQNSSRQGYQRSGLAAPVVSALSLAFYLLANHSGQFLDLAPWGLAGCLYFAFFLVYARLKVMAIDSAFRSAVDPDKTFIEPLRAYREYDAFKEAGESAEQQEAVKQRGELDRLSSQGDFEVNRQVRNLDWTWQYTVWAHISLHKTFGGSEKPAYAAEPVVAVLLLAYTTLYKNRGFLAGMRLGEIWRAAATTCSVDCPRMATYCSCFLALGLTRLQSAPDAVAWLTGAAAGVSPAYLALGLIAALLVMAAFLPAIRMARLRAWVQGLEVATPDALQARIGPATPGEGQWQAGIKANVPVFRLSAAWIHDLGLDRIRLAVESMLLMLSGPANEAAGSFDYQPLIRARFFKSAPDLQDQALADMIKVRTLNPEEVGYGNYFKGLAVGYGRAEAEGRWVVYLPGRAQAWLERGPTATGPMDRLRAATALAWVSHCLEYQGWQFRAALAKGQDSPFADAREVQRHLQDLRSDPAAYMRGRLRTLDIRLQALPLAQALAQLREPELASAVNALVQENGPAAQARFFQACFQYLHRTEGNSRESLLSYLLLSELGSRMPFMSMLVLAQPQQHPLWQSIPASLQMPLRIPQALFRARGFKGLAGRVAVEIQGPFAVDHDALKSGPRRLLRQVLRGSV